MSNIFIQFLILYCLVYSTTCTCPLLVRLPNPSNLVSRDRRSECLSPLRGNGRGLLHPPPPAGHHHGPLYQVSLPAVQGPWPALSNGECSAVQCSGGKRQNVTSCHQVSDPAEDWQPGEFELPEYLHHSINDSQVTEDRAIEI